VNEWDLHRLLAWSSPAYPTGGFSYSHGLEWAVESGAVGGLEDLLDYVTAVLTREGGWVDGVLFAHAWRSVDSTVALDAVARVAAAFRGSAETVLESRQQGAAFLEVTRRAWPHRALDDFARRNGGAPVAHCVVVAITCAAHGIALGPSLYSYLHAAAANLVSAGARLIPLGQTQAQIAVARLAPAIAEVCKSAQETSLEDLGTAALGVEMCSLRHETQYTRLFRS
jgi:urease accessory protein